ncbi:MAG: xanthine dehydrogenase family protein molybdopterin-binding subunit [Proteobacteria bacterium]|nr:xanthine dehydrogenase family protein molybdopterin-binding subunit [Pseudomonadota bacterium]MBU1452686.1 xanthine dehydrogenase family protein molybdopterin-binding subunit [Pseudomonadota bacterium]
MPDPEARRWVGKRYKRKEDLRLLIGEGKFVDDIQLPKMKHAAIIRSPYPHALIKNIDTTQAEKLPGVRGILTGQDVKEMSKPFPCGVPIPPKYYSCAVDKVRYVGEPVAVVVADSRYIAEDALDLIQVDYEPLPVVMDIEEAAEPDAPVLHDNIGSNIYSHRLMQYGEPAKAFEEADLLVKGKFLFPKYGSTPIETYAVVASYNPVNQEFVIYNNYQGPFVNHSLVALALGIPENKMRWIVPTDIGGGFGTKTGVFPYIALIALASKKTGMTVKWIEDRREHLLASATGTDRVTYMEAAVKRDGTILALKDKAMDNTGGYIRAPEPGCAYRSTGNHTGAYQIRHLDREVMVVGTNKCLTSPNRGYTCQELYFSVERLVDMVAAQLGMDPAEIRFKNFIQPDQFPYTTATGGIYDAGNYQKAFQKALDIVDYPKWRQEQEKARQQGRYIGIGIATIVDPSVTNIAYVTTALTPEQRAKGHPKSGSGESMTIKMDPLGQVHVIACTNPQGQGHETVISQIVADELGIDPDGITVSNVVDTHDRVYTITTGSYSSRFASVGTNALVNATRKLKDKLFKIAAHLLEVSPDELVLENQKFHVKDQPEKSIAVRHVAGTAHWHQTALPEGMDVGLFASSLITMPTSKPPDELDRVDSSNTYGFCCEVIVVEIDPETCEIKFHKWASMHDSGTVLNPMILEGQVMGSITHGLGGALYEEFAYDENGQCLTASFQDYLCPTSMEVPDIDIGHVETPSPFTALGSKGAGEASCESVPVAVANAIADALAPLGVVINELPLTPSKIWHLIKEAKAKQA